jgi:hypothetical protein|tara:strand:+ start:122 stop:346 length:225 start_codon:yes stop_codon:yes gene_type:complete
MSVRKEHPDTSWERDANLVLHRLDTIDEELKEMNKRLGHLERNVWSLQAKAAFIGGSAGLVISVCGILINMVIK